MLLLHPDAYGYLAHQRLQELAEQTARARLARPRPLHPLTDAAADALIAVGTRLKGWGGGTAPLPSPVYPLAGDQP